MSSRVACVCRAEDVGRQDSKLIWHIGHGEERVQKLAEAKYVARPASQEHPDGLDIYYFELWYDMKLQPVAKCLEVQRRHFSMYTLLSNIAGGAVFVHNGTNVLIQQSTFANNSATNGGAVYLEVRPL